MKPCYERQRRSLFVTPPGRSAHGSKNGQHVASAAILKIVRVPTPIHDYQRYHAVGFETERTFRNWLKGDWHRAGKNDPNLKEIIAYLFRATGTPVSWQSIASRTSIGSPNTVRSYIETLHDLEALTILNLIPPDGRVDHKKNKKIPSQVPIRSSAVFSQRTFAMGFPRSGYSRGVLASHLSRWYSVYYWRNRSEVDIVCKDGDDQIGFEVKKGVKQRRAAWHIDRAFVLDRDTIHLAHSRQST